jgi:transposase
VEGILWVLRTGARWRDLPAEYPSGATCWRRLRQWEDEGVWLEAWQQLLAALNHRQLLQWDETFLDGSFVSAKKGALLLEKPSVGRGQSGWYWSMARAFLWQRNWRALHRRKSRSPNQR